MLFSFEGAILQGKDPVTIAKWTHLNSYRTQKLSTSAAKIVGLHLNSYRTQKLSTSAAKIVGLAPANIARCRVLFFWFFQVVFQIFSKNIHKFSYTFLMFLLL